MAEQAEHVFTINRRRLLTSATAVMAAAIMPLPGEPGEAAAIQPGPLAPEAPAQMFSAANAKRLLEITRRNSLRKEAGLPLLSVTKEIRLMKNVETGERFPEFSATFRNRVRDKALARIQPWQNDAYWKPADK